MTTLTIALFVVVCVAAICQAGALHMQTRATRFSHPAKPLSILAGELAVDIADVAHRTGRESLHALGIVARHAAVVLVEPEAASAPELAAYTASAPVHHIAPIRIIRREVALAIADVIDPIEARFERTFSTPGQARTAARLLITSLALACSGAVGVLSMVGPGPVLRLQPAASVVARSALGPSANVAPPAGLTPTPAPTPTASRAAHPRKPATTLNSAPAPAAAPDRFPSASPPNARGALPVGKGMWIWQPARADGGNVDSIVGRAEATGLTHIYVQTGSTKQGLLNQQFIDDLLPRAHAAHIRVYGWDFPKMSDPGADVQRAWGAISRVSPSGDMLDGFTADIETSSEGTALSADAITAYTTWLRQAVGDGYPLIATVPAPTAQRRSWPYREAIAHFDAFAPMVYWLNRDAGTDAANAMAYLSQFGKPIFPIGQAYDGGPEGGRPGLPAPEEIINFMQRSQAGGAPGASFWEWSHADQPTWDIIGLAGEFRLIAGPPEALSPPMVRSYQTLLTGFGFATPTDGVWGPSTADAVRAYQQAAHLPVTGVIDEPTKSMLFTPFHMRTFDQ